MTPFPLDGGRAGDGGENADVSGVVSGDLSFPVASSPPSPTLPPSRGKGVRLTSSPFDPGALLSGFASGRSEVGAVVSFTGLCRSAPGLIALELEAYPGFTEAVIRGVAQTTVSEHDLLDLEVIHRVGRIAVGEPIVWVAAAAAHRRAAFLGCDRMMDFLKSKAPFWKREHRRGGGSRWIEPTAQDHADVARWGANPPESDR